MFKKSCEMPCEGCKLRASAEAKPTSFVAWFWRLHTTFCPCWKDYKQAVKQEQEAAEELLFA